MPQTEALMLWAQGPQKPGGYALSSRKGAVMAKAGAAQWERGRAALRRPSQKDHGRSQALLRLARTMLHG